MQNKLLALIALSAALFLYSCEITIIGGDTGGSSITRPNYPPRTFYATNIVSDSVYRLSAEMFYEGSHCNVWVEEGSGVSVETANALGSAYDWDIYPRMIDNFSVKNVTYEGYTFNNALEFADALGDVNGKLTILLLDIKDTYSPGRNNTFVGGYFWSGDFSSAAKGSNLCDMIYIDAYPQNPGSREAYKTLAHETQHMMNFVTSVLLDRQSLMDTWIDEGLSSAAEWIYAGENPTRVDNFQNDYSGLIKEGNNFFVWDNHTDNNYALLDDYSTVYLFFQYLRAQSSSSIYSKIMGSSYVDYRAVTQALRGNNDWGGLLKSWLAANYINAPSGEYGYKNDSELKNIHAPTAPAGRTSYRLAPGEGVYSITNSGGSVPPAGTNIKYAGLNTSARTLSDSATFSGGVLLSYNVNTNTSGATESGTTTGVAASVDTASGTDASRTAVQQAAPSGPYRIDAGDLFRRNGLAAGLSGFDPPLGLPDIRERLSRRLLDKSAPPKAE